MAQQQLPVRIWITNAGWSEADCAWKVQIGTQEETVAYAWVPSSVGDRTGYDRAVYIAERICEGWNS